MSSASVKGYDRLAPFYEHLELLVFGSQLMRARTALLDALPPVKNVLVLGEGDGRFLSALLARQPACSVAVLEQSPKMVELAHHRLTPQQRSRVTFFLGDAVSFALGSAGGDAARYDLVVTAFFLDCFDEDGLGVLVPRLAAALEAGGWWYYADFATPPAGWRRLRAEGYLAALHAFFRWQTGLQTWRLADPTPLFERYLKSVKRLEHSHGLLTTRLYRRLG